MSRYGSADEDTRSNNLYQLHADLVRGVPEARNSLARLLLERSREILRRKFRLVDAAIIEDACEDAVLGYLAHPDRYDPSRSGLETYVCFGASRRVLQTLRANRRRLMAETRASSESQLVQPALCEQPSEEAEMIRALVASTTDETERRVAEAWLHGSDQAELAAVLGLDGTPTEQRRQVKRLTERLRIRWRRLFGRTTS